MTLKEAKDILKKEFAVIGLHKSTEPFEFDDSHWFGYEKPSVLEAFRVLAKEGYYVTISGHDYDMRKKRLQKEYEENTKAPGSAENSIKEDSGVNPALKESASQFNDALLDEQAKKIVELAEENERLKDQVAVLYANKENNEKYNLKQIKRLGKEIARLNKIIHKKNLKIEELKEESSERLDGKVKYYGETVDLTQELFYKNEELRLSKIREKNLTEVCQKYMKENEAQKDLVDDISLRYDGAKHNLKLRIDECEKLKKELDVAKKQNTAVMVDMTAKCFRAARESINDVFESYAAKYAKSTLDDLKEKAYESFNAKACNLGFVGSKDGNGIIDQMIGVDIAKEGADHSAIISQCCKNIAISKDEAEIIERCTKNGTELHYSEKDGFTYTNMFGDEIPIICLRGMCQVFTDEEIKNMKK